MKKVALKIKLSILLVLSCTIVNAQNHYIIASADVNNEKYLTTVLQPENDVKSIHLHLEQHTITRKNHPLETTGKILTFVGVPLAILGGLLVSQADEYYYTCSSSSSSSSSSYNQNQTNGCQGDPKGGFGIVALALGVGMSATGIVLWTIGSKK